MHTQHISLSMSCTAHVLQATTNASDKAKNTERWSTLSPQTQEHGGLFADQNKRILQLLFEGTISRSEPNPEEMKDATNVCAACVRDEKEAE